MPKFPYRSLILMAIMFTLCLVPSLFWGKTSFVGGDDSKLYYLFPLEYFKNFTLNIISDNQLGSLGNYFPQLYISLFVLMVLIVRSALPFLNTQLLFFGLNLAGGFFFFYLFVGLWLREKRWENFAAKVAGALLYSTSTFYSFSLLSSQLFGMYFLAIFPAVMYLFFKGVWERKTVYVVISALLFSCFSILILSVPWLVALIIAIFPLGIYVLIHRPVRTILMSVLFVILIVLLNFYWLFHFVYGTFGATSHGNTNVVHSAVQVESRTANEFLIRSVSKHNELIYPLFNLFHKSLQQDYGWSSYDTFANWYLVFFLINAFFPVVIVVGALLLRGHHTSIRRVYFVTLFSWLLTLYFFTANIGNWGLNLFLWLNNTVPGFVMFRNMYDKFGPALAFSYGLMFALGVSAVTIALPKKNWKICFLGLCFGAVLYSAKPLIFDEYHKDPLWTTQHIYSRIHDFNPDFYALLSYIKNMPTAERFLWLPITSANYVLVRDSIDPYNYYIGVSPLQFLAGKSDLNGQLSFQADMSKEVVSDILGHKYDRMGLMIQEMGAKYIIVNNDIDAELQKSYLYTYQTVGDLYTAQDKSFISHFAGKKIRDFGSRYSLYEVNSQYPTQRIYLTSNDTVIPSTFANVTYHKVNSGDYVINVEHVKSKMKLVFLDPYHEQWGLYWSDSHVPFITGPHGSPFQYANSWELDPQKILSNTDKRYFTKENDGSLSFTFHMYFQPQSYQPYVTAISAATAGFLLVYLAVVGILQLRAHKRENPS